MKISYNWLRELTGTALAPRDLAEQLTMVGLAVDAVHEFEDDFVLEFDITSNRPDCLSHLGVARELAVIERGTARLPDSKIVAEGRAEQLTSVEIREPGLCPRYAARIVRGVRVGASPAWLIKRLQAIGQRPINNVADITNYVLHEVGQPLHAFDFAKLAERRIVVRRATADETIKTLDGVVRTLTAEMLVIADAVRPVAVAGVMGGEESEVSDSTTDVLIESAYFNAESIRRTARSLGLHTEASYRFERGVDYEGVLRAQERAVDLICDLAGGTATENAVDLYPQALRPAEVDLRPARIEGLTSLSVPLEEMLRILRALGFTPREQLQATEASRTGETAAAAAAVATVAGGGDNDRRLQLAADGGRANFESNTARISSLSFTAPTWRVDIEREEDLIEEVARHFGYQKIIDDVPATNVSGSYRTGDARRREARRALIAGGCDEAISFSFIDASHDGRFDLLPGFVASADNDGSFVTLINPIIEGATRMRPTLLQGLLEAVRQNFNHGTRDVRLFEIGRVFAAGEKTEELPAEREALALVLTGGALEAGRAGATRELDFYDLKGALEAAVEAMKITAPAFSAARARHLSEGQAAHITVDGRAVGTLGRLSDEVSGSYKFRQAVFVAELDFSALLAARDVPVRYTPLARYPPVVRDVSLLIDRRVAFADMQRAVVELGLENCRGVMLADVFEGASVPAQKRSVTLRIEYRANERTLRDEEVDELHQRVVGALERNFDARVRS